MGERPKPEVPVVTSGNTDDAEFEAARCLVQSGVAAFRQGRFAAAVDDLQRASQRLQTLRQSLRARIEPLAEELDAAIPPPAK